MPFEFTRSSCPSCGGKLTIAVDISKFNCVYCGSEFAVDRIGGTISLRPLVEKIDEVAQGIDRTAAELAIVRIERELVKARADLVRAGAPAVQARASLKSFAAVFCFAFFSNLVLYASTPSLIPPCMSYPLIGISIICGIVALIALPVVRRGLPHLEKQGSELRVRVQKLEGELEKHLAIVRGENA